jgi:hypothetical protein
MTDQLRKLKAGIVYHKLGIVPLGIDLGGAEIHQDMNRVLAQLSRKDARTMKRKFRKAWRVAVKAALRHGGKAGWRLAQELGFQCQEPRRNHKQARKGIVKFEVYKKINDGVNSRDLW